MRRVIPHKVKPNNHTKVDFTKPLARGCVGFWQLNDKNNTSIRDAAKARYGIATGSPTWGIVNGEQAITLGGTDEDIEIPNSTGAYDFGTGEFTYMVRLKVGAGGVGVTKVALSTRASAGWWFGKINTDVVRFNMVGGNVTGSINIADDEFHTLIATRKGDTLYVAVDGVIDNSAVRTASTDGDGILHIGAFGTVAGFDWDGEISLAGVWNRGFSADEIRLFSKNPYQILQPRTQLINVTAGVAPPSVLPAGSLSLLGVGI